MLRTVLLVLFLTCLPVSAQNTKSTLQHKWYEDPSFVATLSVFLASSMGGIGIYVGKMWSNNLILQQRIDTKTAIEEAIVRGLAEPIKLFHEKQLENKNALDEIEKTLNTIVREITITLNSHSTELVKLNKLMEYREEIAKLNLQRIEKLEKNYDVLELNIQKILNRVDNVMQFLNNKHNDFSLVQRL